MNLCAARPAFEPHPLLRHPHFMTIIPRFWPRRSLLKGIPTDPRLFTVVPDTQLLGHCHWQPDCQSHRTVILIHGLEGSSESHYMQGTARKAWQAGCNVVRLNQRNCGGTEPLTPTLYHSGLSGDLAAHYQPDPHNKAASLLWAFNQVADELKQEFARIAAAIADMGRAGRPRIRLLVDRRSAVFSALPVGAGTWSTLTHLRQAALRCVRAACRPGVSAVSQRRRKRHAHACGCGAVCFPPRAGTLRNLWFALPARFQ